MQHCKELWSSTKAVCDIVKNNSYGPGKSLCVKAGKHCLMRVTFKPSGSTALEIIILPCSIQPHELKSTLQNHFYST